MLKAPPWLFFYTLETGIDYLIFYVLWWEVHNMKENEYGFLKCYYVTEFHNANYIHGI